MDGQTLVRRIRDQLEITPARLAELLGVAPDTVASWERGELAPSPYHHQRLQEWHDSLKPDFQRQMDRHAANKRTPEALLVLRAMIQNTARWDKVRGIDPRERCWRARTER